MHSTNPWPLVRWAAAALIYLGTLAIAWDQIAMREAKIAEFERWQKETRAGLNRMADTADAMIADADTAAELLLDLEKKLKR